MLERGEQGISPEEMAKMEESRIKNEDDAHEIALSGKRSRDAAHGPRKFAAELKSRKGHKVKPDYWKKAAEPYERVADGYDKTAERNEQWTAQAIELAKNSSEEKLRTELTAIKKRQIDDSDWDLEVRGKIVENALRIQSEKNES